MSLRHWFPALAAFTLLAASSPASATSPLLANGDYPYWKLDYARYDTTYAAVERKARHQASFRWDSTVYCRYRTGWQGPGAPADHEGDADMAQVRAEYAREFAREPVCAPIRHHRRIRREIVLRRKD